MDNKDQINPNDLSTASFQSMSQQMGTPSNNYANNMGGAGMGQGFMFPPFGNQNQMGMFMNDMQKPNQQSQNNGNSGQNMNNMMANFEMFQNMMRMFQGGNQQQQMFPQMNTQSSGNSQSGGMNPMDYFQMMNNMNGMMVNNMQGMNNFNMMGQSQRLNSGGQSNKDLKVGEMFNKNMNDLNQFYQFLNQQSKDLNQNTTNNSMYESRRRQTAGSDYDEDPLPSSTDFRQIHTTDEGESYRNTTLEPQNPYAQGQQNFSNRKGPQKNSQVAMSHADDLYDEDTQPSDKRHFQQQNSDQFRSNGKMGSMNSNNSRGNQLGSNRYQDERQEPMRMDDFSDKENYDLGDDDAMAQRQLKNPYAPNQNQKKPQNYDNFDEKPIHGGNQNNAPKNPYDDNLKNYLSPEDEKPAKQTQQQNRYNPEDDRPIQPAQNTGALAFDDIPIRSNNHAQNKRPATSNGPISRQNKRKHQEEDDDDDYNSQPINTYEDPFDEMPITGKNNKRFEDLLEEQLSKNPHAVSQGSASKKRPSTSAGPVRSTGGAGGKKTFLKRGSGFLSSAALKSQAAKKPVSSEQSARDNYSEQGNYQSQPIRKNPEVMTFKNDASPISNHESNQPESTNKVKRASSTKKFLTRGAGTGGGIGKNATGEPEEKPTTRSLTPQNRKSPRRAGNNPPETTFDRFSKLKYDGNNNQKGDDSPKRGARHDESPFGKESEDSYDREYIMERYANSSSKKQTQQSPKYQFDDEQEFDEDDEDGGNHLTYVKRSNKKPNKQSVVSPKNNNFMFSTGLADDNDGGYSPSGAGIKKQMVEKAKKSNSSTPRNTDQVQKSEDAIQQYVDEKVEALNSEISKFKLENERVKKIRVKHEEMLKNLQKEISEWNKQKEKEIKQLEDWKKEELEQIKKDKKEAEKAHRSIQNSTSKKDREEIDNLKKQIVKMKEDLSSKEKRSNNMIDKLKKQVEDLTNKNKVLMNDLKNYEQMRLKGTLNASAVQQKHARDSQVRGSGQFNNNRSINKSNYRDQEEDEEEEEEEYKEEEEEEYEEEDQHQDDEEEEEDENKFQNNDVIQEEDEEDDDYDNVHKRYDHFMSRNSAQNQGQSPKGKSGMTLNTLGIKTGNYASGNDDMGSASNPFRTDNSQKRQNETPRGFGTSNVGASGTLKNNNFGSSTAQITDLEHDYKYDSNPYFKQYQQKKGEVAKIANQTVSSDGKIQRAYADGKKEVVFHNGVKREIWPDGYTIVHFTNNDIKQTLPDGTVIYYFSEAQTTQTTMPNGRNIYRFANNQIELHHENGTKDIFFSDGTKKFIFVSGEEETVFTDGTVQRINTQKIKTIDYANGQKDVVYPDGLKVRTYPDGRIKKYYPNGTVEES